ncbi:MGDG synthase family glycosyltransferase [Sediminibacillus albus]|uniref:UDP-N-acetylglucosamine:LPS N-acetylglucosamine transferase n=1 Tax=Sediminibacillus albus TaxID=407036 RepID=A0A1G8WWA0_9BACI|nr:UDP-glucuronosyltransferase [Sediminibacillus albus]SDJ82672.1 UDP-N-acetylglucosamine:LPS N-acetylglucosamine transferase [Sediminibacillus albus]
MKKVLILPFLQIPSGHHQVADSIIDGLAKLDSRIACKKIDILAYTFGRIESIVSGTYLKWIHHFPKTYSWLYHRSVYDGIQQQKQFKAYQLLFAYAMKKVLDEEKPDAVICTHALPSYIMNQIKQTENIAIPLINIYTDFFAHRLWGIEQVDMHLVSSLIMRDDLINKGARPSSIYVTGIPTHADIRQTALQHNNNKAVLITGGSLGVGRMETLLNIPEKNQYQYFVLCGKNKNLYEKLCKRKHGSIIPLPYIDSRKEMDQLYDQVNAIVTKPGGVTISECIRKRKPAFVYHALPGQEEINLQHLKQLGIVIDTIDCQKNLPIEKQITAFFEDKNQLESFQKNLDRYHNCLSHDASSLILDALQMNT